MADGIYRHAFMALLAVGSCLGCGGEGGSSKGNEKAAAGTVETASSGATTGGSRNDATGGRAAGGNPTTDRAGAGGTDGGQGSTGDAGTGISESPGTGGRVGAGGEGATGGGETSGGAAVGGGASAGAGGTQSTGGTSGVTEAGGSGTGGTAAGGAGMGGTSLDSAGSAGSAGDAGGAETGGEGGTPSIATLELDPSSGMDFGAVAPGSTAVATYTLTNRGATTSGVPSITVDSTGENLGTPYPITVTGCSAALAPGESCELTISVTPNELGLLSAFVRVEADPGTQGQSSSYLSIRVQGWGSALEISPSSNLELGDVRTDSEVVHRITVTAWIAISDLEVWAVGDEVSIDTSESTCTEILAAGSSCVLSVRFVSPTLGWKEGMVGIRSGGSMGHMLGVAITANVTNGSALAIDPDSPPTFVVPVEEASEPVVFTVTNQSETTSGVIESTFVGDSATDFQVIDSDCTTLDPGEACTISVVCDPVISASAAPIEARLSVSDGNSQVSVPLNATLSFDP